MEPAAHIAALEREGALLADAAGRAGLAAPVPSCPSWQTRDLLRHLGYVHRWAAAYVAERIAEPVAELTEAEQLAGGPPDGELVAWFRAGHAALTATLRSAAPGMYCWAFLDAPSPLAFWARRQAHETAIHRADAQLAAGEIPEFESALAVDGIDELLLGFFRRDSAGQEGVHQRGPGGAAGEPGRTLRVRAADTADEWFAAISADGRLAASVVRGPGPAGPAGCVLVGPASGLYQMLWNRSGAEAARVTVTGDDRLLRDWQDGMHVRWG
jgi:uncharacterized protein (TIGR03083 family)